jgi:DNA-binding response OmpR family regulator
MNDTKKTVLIADDDPDLLEQLEWALRQWGFDVLTAETEAQAEEILQTTKPDLAIFDLMMENRDSGFVLSYKTKKRYPDVPVIIVTAVAGETGVHFDTTTDEVRRWVKADIILDKDIRFEQLKKEIDRFLGENHG